MPVYSADVTKASVNESDSQKMSHPVYSPNLSLISGLIDLFPNNGYNLFLGEMEKISERITKSIDF